MTDDRFIFACSRCGEAHRESATRNDWLERVVEHTAAHDFEDAPKYEEATA